MTEFFQNWKPIIYSLSIVIGAGITGLILHVTVFRVLNHLKRMTSNALYESLIKHTRRPTKYLVILLTINIAIPIVDLPQSLFYIFDSIFRSTFILSMAWLNAKPLHDALKRWDA